MAEPWSETKENVLTSLNTSAGKGLSRAEVNERLKKFGANKLAKERTVTFWGIFKEEVTEPMILLLLVVGIVYSIPQFGGDLRDAITIFSVIILLVLSEIYTEYRAKKAVVALRKLSPMTAAVLRDGVYQRVTAEDVVSGELLILEAGDRVPADARIIESVGLEVNESTLTGESTPVAKEEKLLPSSTALADRINMVFAGTTVNRGSGKAVVTATGMNTELGRITGLILEAREPRTPLQLAMRQLAGTLVWVAVFFSVLIPVVGIIQGKPYQQMVLTGLSLSFATIPEELPIIITMVLGVGAFALSRTNVLVRRLKAAETLGSVTVIATDKTGTITENRMTLTSITTGGAPRAFAPGNLSPADRLLLETAVVTSHIKKGSDSKYIGDPMEVAFLEAASLAKIVPEELVSQFHLKQEFSFDSQRKMMSVVSEKGNETLVYAKGAPEVILAKSSRIVRNGSEQPITPQDGKAISTVAEGMAGEAMRVLAFAYKKIPSDMNQDDAEKDLTFIGLAGLTDPPRAGVKEAIKITKEAGIKTIVVSGDHALTVQRIAAEVGIDNNADVITGAELDRMSDPELKEKLKIATLFARTNPEQKLRLVKLLQESDVVAVTGDGINDAPALKSADIGIAMGETGTEVARETADMILTDDSFTSIVAGVREGRKIFSNLKKGVSYYLSVKVALVLSFLVPLSLSITLPFAPIQIILLELFMDLAASATFVAEPVEPDIMRIPPPRRTEKFLNRTALTNIFLGSISLAAAVLINYFVAWYSGMNVVHAQTIAFGTWLVGHIFLAFTMRSQRDTVIKMGIFSNPVMLIWAAAAVLFLIIATSIPALQGALKVTSLGLRDWIMIVVVPFVTIFWFEIKKAVTSPATI